MSPVGVVLEPGGLDDSSVTRIRNAGRRAFLPPAKCRDPPGLAGKKPRLKRNGGWGGGGRRSRTRLHKRPGRVCVYVTRARTFPRSGGKRGTRNDRVSFIGCSLIENAGENTGFFVARFLSVFFLWQSVRLCNLQFRSSNIFEVRAGKWNLLWLKESFDRKCFG